MTVPDFIAYLTILFFATIIPGPSMLLALSHGANYGKARTIYSGLGNTLGNILIAFISVAGLGILLFASGVIFTIVKWLGAAYLVYLGIRLILQSSKDTLASKMQQTNVSKTNFRIFMDGFAIAIGNPKGIVFFTALFPQFIDLSNTTVSEFLMVFISLSIVAFVCFMLYAVFGSFIQGLFIMPSFRKIYNRITGVLFIAFGIFIAFAKK